MGKLYAVRLYEEVDYLKIRETAKKINSLCVINVVEPQKVYEFQDKTVAEKIVEVYGGDLQIIDYNIKNFLK